MTVPLDTPDPDKRLAGARRSIDQLLRRQQIPDTGVTAYANLTLLVTPFSVATSTVTSIPFANFTTSDADIFSWSSPTISLLKQGLYLCSGTIEWDGGAASFFRYAIWSNQGLDIHVVTPGNSSSTTTIGTPAQSLWNQEIGITIVTSPPLAQQLQVYHEAGANKSVKTAHAALVYLGAFLA